MWIHKVHSRAGIAVVALAGLAFAPLAVADDEDDVLAIVMQYGETENDLAAQARLMRSDRVFINQGRRQTDEARNMANQMAMREANEALNGGKTVFRTTIEGPIVSVYDDVAVASFIRWWNVFPHGQQPAVSTPTWVTLVLVREGGDWRIKHTHQSSAATN